MEVNPDNNNGSLTAAESACEQLKLPLNLTTAAMDKRGRCKARVDGTGVLSQKQNWQVQSWEGKTQVRI